MSDSDTTRAGLDLDTWTLGDVVDFEDAAGVSPFQAFAGGAPSSRALLALAWIERRRKDAEFTLEDARKVSFAELSTLLNGPDPSSPSGDGAAPST